MTCIKLQEKDGAQCSRSTTWRISAPLAQRVKSQKRILIGVLQSTVHSSTKRVRSCLSRRKKLREKWLTIPTLLLTWRTAFLFCPQESVVERLLLALAKPKLILFW